jgi:hypothetical protein
MKSRAGVAWYEILMAIAAIGSITALAVPMTEDQGRQAIASSVLSDVDSVRSAVYRFYSDSGYFPAEAGFTTIPDGLAGYLPRGFGFRRSYGTLEYKNWALTTAYGETSASNVIGISVVTVDPKVGAAAIKRYANNAKFVVGTRRVFLIFGA